MEDRPDEIEESYEGMVRKLRETFREEAYELLIELEQALLELEKTPRDAGQIDRVFRALHTIKGSGGSCAMDDVSAFAHEIENFFDLVRKGKVDISHEIIDLSLAARDRIKDMFDAYYLGRESSAALRTQVLAAFRGLLSGEGANKKEAPLAAEKHDPQTGAESTASIRVATEKLDNLVNLVGELVTVQARLSQTALGRGTPEFLSIAEAVERLTADLRDLTMNIRMLPIGSLFSRFHRLVRDLSGKLGKEIDLVLEGADTELDKTVIERLNDPLVHVIRNCMDHGIEAPAVREASGKPRRGKISLCASHEGTQVQIRISDDGAGLDRERIRAKAIQQGLLSESSATMPREIFACIFAPGFSTAAEVTNVSGRGVGLDVVRRALDALGGTIEVASDHGAGTSFTLKLPLTLAIIDGFLTLTGQEHYIFPMSLVEECVELVRGPQDNGASRLVAVRGSLIPYISLREQFGIDGEHPAIEQVVIVRQDGQRIGFAVDQVIGGHQSVIKSLGTFYRNAEGLSGATILGDGSLALILDVPRLVRIAEQEESRLYRGVP